MRNPKLEAAINAIVGLIVARLVYWGGERLELPTALSIILAIVIAGACGWLLGSLREKRIIPESNGS
jgi:ribose/xylose/arabinose/galactoside ABC-type transport system permease subunit